MKVRSSEIPGGESERAGSLTRASKEPDQSQKVPPHWGSPFGALELRSGKISWMVKKSLRSVDSVHTGR